MGCLKPSVIFSAEPAAPELADTMTRRRLRLTATEARVLSKFDGSQTAKELALWAANEGLAIGPLQLQVMLERLARAGFLLSAPHVPPQDARDVGFAPSDDPLTLAHIVPSMRNDLKIVASLGSRSTYDVSDPLAHRSFTLYDFEVSIARMLDGRRNAGQVIEASAKIGIPVTLESLRRFLLQLKAFKFLSAEPADLAKRGPRSTWPMRADWTEDLRQLFQNALRLLRSGKLPESREFLLAMLEIDPMNKEGQETKARVDDLMRDPIVEITFADLHGEPASSTGALLDSHLRVPVALPPPEPIESAPAPPPVLSVGARPTAPEMLLVEPLEPLEPVEPVEPLEPVEPVAPSQPLLASIVDIEIEEPMVPVERLVPIESMVPEVEPSPMGEGGQRPGEGADELLPVVSEPVVSEPVVSEPIVSEPVVSEPEAPEAIAETRIAEEPIAPPVGEAGSSSAVPPTGPSDPLPPTREGKKGGRWRRVLILLLLAAVGGLLSYPLPRTRVIACELSPVVVATVLAPRPGTIEELSVTEGQVVEKGQALATLSTKGTAAELERLRTRAAALEKQLDQLAKTVKPAEVAKAREALAAKTKELTQATDQKRRLEAKHSPAAAIAHAEKEVRAKQALVDKAAEQLAQVSQEEKLGTGRQVVEGLKRESAQLQTEVAEARIVAPEAGRLEGLVTNGAVLADHAPFARLVSPARLTVVAHHAGISGATDLAGATVSGTSVSDLHPVGDGADPDLSGTLSEPSLKPGPATLKIPLGKRAWGLELYERARSMIH